MKERYLYNKGLEQQSWGKNLSAFQTQALVIEDAHGMRTPYYPGLTWNGVGFSALQIHPHECLNNEERQILQERVGVLIPQSTGSMEGRDDLYVCPPVADVTRTKKVSSVKKILRDISYQYESVFAESPFGSEVFNSEREGFFHSNLLYLIAATDGNEDTIGHSQLVARYTLQLTRAIGIEDKDFLADMERGAMLHDIGKIGIPESILRKPGPLTTMEKEIVKEHPALGYEMIEEFSFLKKASRVVLFHHESYDGQGYPYGLLREEIPVEARIFALADTLDAITSDRPYRKGQSFQSAFDEIEKARGIQFDPSVVDAFFSVPEKRWKQIKSETEESLRQQTIH